jgi:hypothetical protein
MAKTVNYTTEQTVELVQAYSAAENDEARADVVQAFAEKLGRKVQSVRQKLVREGVYQKKARTTKNGGEIVSKADLVARIAAAVEADVESFDSLAKANKTVLETLADHLSDD